MMRTHGCGEISPKLLKKTIQVCGWVHRRRDHGGVSFFDVRDRSGILQTVFSPESKLPFDELRPEFVVQMSGQVRERPKGTKNPKLKTGAVELDVKELTILNRSETPPFEISKESDVTDEMRLQYRYLDLRRPGMQEKLSLRHQLIQACRSFLNKQDFLEVDTPILTRSTPEGARDYLVPSRLNPGQFYALPQSPQLFKQLLMVAGLERYYQVAKCFRDEDLRSDRQPEFTQLDMELSFVEEEDVFAVTEDLMVDLFKQVLGLKVKKPFPKISYQEAMDRYGTDKPDLRNPMTLVNVSDCFAKTEFKRFEEILSSGGIIKALKVPGGGSLGRAQIDKIRDLSIQAGAKGVVDVRVTAKGPDSPVLKFVGAEALGQVVGAVKATEKDLVLLVADQPAVVNAALDLLRRSLGEQLKLVKKEAWQFVWVKDFPLFVYDEETKRWASEHHPFTSPVQEDIVHLKDNQAKVRARAYDLVVNGVELGSGSIRIHQTDLQENIFQVLGMSTQEAKARFGFLLEALRFGAPPHAGIAFGLDRLAALMCGSATIRDVIPFPKTQKAVCLMTGAPSGVDARQLKELNLSIQGGKQNA